MPIDKDLEAALEALGRREGKDGNEVLRDLLGEKVRAAAGAAPPRAALSRTDTGDASRPSRAEAIARHHEKEFPGSPVVRYGGDPYNETPEEAQERWLTEEAELDDGVHGLGGQTAGGIFGDGAISTAIYDPGAMGRADARAGQHAVARIMSLADRFERRLEQMERGARGELPGGQTRQLPKKR